MNKNVEINSLSERMNMASWEFYGPLRFTDLVVTDLDDHSFSVEQVYHGMLREAGVVDECVRRFKRQFKRNDFFITEI